MGGSAGRGGRRGGVRGALGRVGGVFGRVGRAAAGLFGRGIRGNL